MSDKQKLRTMLNKKIVIQELEQENNDERQHWQHLGERIRSRSQKIYKLRDKLFESI